MTASYGCCFYSKMKYWRNLTEHSLPINELSSEQNVMYINADITLDSVEYFSQKSLKNWRE